MKEVPFQIEQQNIFEMLTGNQFYENVDAYLREALLNAIDSCCMRQVLQYSWGAEFMERERDERIAAEKAAENGGKEAAN